MSVENDETDLHSASEDFHADFPDIDVRFTIGNIYEAFFIHFIRIFRLTLLPLIISTGAYIYGDYYLDQTHVSQSSFILVAILVQAVQALMFYLFSLPLYRLMLLGNWESVMSLDKKWRTRMFIYAKKALLLFILMLMIIFILLFCIRLLAQTDLGIALAAIPLALLYLGYIFLRFCLVLPATAVDAPYRLLDSWRATRGISGKILIITACTILPALILLISTIEVINFIQPSVELLILDTPAYSIHFSYWYLAPIGMYLSYVVTTFVIITTAVIFYFRTGWRPGSERVDL